MSAAAILEVEGLGKSFGDFKAVDGVSFSVPAGECFALLGPNGAGKTTTIKMLTTLLRPDAGRALLDGHDVVHDPEGARRSFGIVFQDPSLDDELTARENMDLHAVLYGLPRGARAARVREMLGFVDLGDRADSRVKTFSGGMKRRLEIARGLLHHPRVLFLDEPTVGLDPQTRNHIWTYLKDLRRAEGVAVFLTTHYMEEAERAADRVAIIDHGRLLTQDSPAGLRASTGTATLEEAFIRLTGHGMRPEEADGTDRMRGFRKMWGRR